MPKRTGTAFRWSKKEQERRSGAFRLEKNPGRVSLFLECQPDAGDVDLQAGW